MTNWFKKNWLGIVPFSIIFLVFEIFSNLQWKSVMSNSPDLGIFTQLIMKYASFQAPYSEIKNMIIFGDHFSPAVVLAVPFYWIMPNGLGVMTAENFFFAAAAVFVFLAARTRFNKIPSVLISLAFGFSFGIQYAVNAQFHEIAIGTLILAISLFLYLKKQYLPSAIVIALLVFVKEDCGAIVFVYGIILWVLLKNWKYIFLSIWAVLVTSLALFVITPAFNIREGNTYISSLFVNIDAQSINDFIFLLFLTAIAGVFLWLKSPIALLVVPELVVRFISSGGVRATNVQYFWQYDALDMVILTFALIDVIPYFFKLFGLGSVSKKLLPARRVQFTTAVFSAMLIVSLIISFINPSFKTPLNALINQAPGESQYHFDYTTSKVVLDETEFDTTRYDQLQEVIDALDKDVSTNKSITGKPSVAVDRNPLAYLVSPNRDTYFVPIDPIDKELGKGSNCVSPNYDNCYYTWPKGLVPDYYVISNYGIWAQSNPDVVAVAKNYYPNEEFETVYSNDTYQLGKRVVSSKN
jgi:uncharacterized membrane protein